MWVCIHQLIWLLNLPPKKTGNKNRVEHLLGSPRESSSQEVKRSSNFASDSHLFLKVFYNLKSVGDMFKDINTNQLLSCHLDSSRVRYLATICAFEISSYINYTYFHFRAAAHSQSGIKYLKKKWAPACAGKRRASSDLRSSCSQKVHKLL